MKHTLEQIRRMVEQFHLRVVDVEDLALDKSHRKHIYKVYIVPIEVPKELEFYNKSQVTLFDIPQNNGLGAFYKQLSKLTSQVA